MTQQPIDPSDEPLGGSLTPPPKNSPEATSMPTAGAGNSERDTSQPPPPPPAAAPGGGYPPPPPAPDDQPAAFPPPPPGSWGAYPPPPTGSGVHPPAFPPVQYPGPQFAQPPYPAALRTSGRATAVMVLGIVSLVMVCAYGIGFILAVVALALAPGARREIRASAGMVAGEGQLKAGVICSWITVGLTVAGVIFSLIALGISSSTGY